MESIGTSSVLACFIGEAYIEGHASADRSRVTEATSTTTSTTTSNSASATLRPVHRFAPHAVRLAALWVLAGGASKAISGMPTDLPYFFATHDFDPVAVITAGVLVEFTIAIFALVNPRAGRIALAALLALFILLLRDHIAHTDASCGCFGGANIPVSVMIGIDFVCFALLAWTLRAAPAKASANRTILGVLGALAIGSAAAAFTHNRLASSVSSEPLAQITPPAAEIAAKVVAPAKPAWELPTTIPEQVILRPLQWIGKPLAETPLGTWVDTSGFPLKARMVFFYKSCNHCADLLKRLAGEQAANPASAPVYVLVQLPTPPAYTGKLFVDTVPNHALWVELPSAVKAYVMTPPWIVDIDGGQVARAERIAWPGEKAAGK